MLLSTGQACSYPMKGTHAKYGGFAYSSAYAYSVPPGLFSLEQYALAGQMGLSDDGGETWRPRRLSSYAALEHRGAGAAVDPVLVSVWHPFPDVAVRTLLVPPTAAAPNWHLRAHRVGPAGRDVMTADGAFAVRNERVGDGRALGPYDAARAEGTRPIIIGNYDLASPAGWATGGDGAVAVSATDGAVGIRALESAGARSANLVNADPNSNLVRARTVIPTLQHTVRRGETAWYVSAVYAKPGGPPAAFLDGWDGPPAIPAWLAEEMARD